ncbi:Ca2+ sensor (EF-Hand superfamily) [Trachipleistophora hominis]|uniref:Ca2+ sensor (EF-Hand superfamily) n=1 Tax=Trachipleistophora hominis TaxID=72359 RepID=L7JV65_TRAHO|nr:Ca2+ sensor (EF-Hand superfamily) [Trachipleistophora hominis]
MGNKVSPNLLQTAATVKKFSHFNESDIKKWSAEFNANYPSGYMTEKDLQLIFKKLFPFGECNRFTVILFRTINISGTKTIDFNELLIAYSILRKGSIFEKLRWIFRLYDCDSDGVVGKDEMIKVVKAFLDMIGASFDVNVDVGRFISNIFDDLENKSGFLTFDDFKILAGKKAEVLQIFEVFD